jgi:hypothetical protein
LATPASQSLDLTETADDSSGAVDDPADEVDDLSGEVH